VIHEDIFSCVSVRGEPVFAIVGVIFGESQHQCIIVLRH
jgi:hypothetical protein